MRHRCPGRMHNTEEVDIDTGPERLHVIGLNGADVVSSGIVHQRVQAPVVFDDTFDALRCRIHVRDVQLPDVHRDSRSHRASPQILGALRVPQRRHRRPAGPRRRYRRGQPDT